MSQLNIIQCLDVQTEHIRDLCTLHVPKTSLHVIVNLNFTSHIQACVDYDIY